VRLQRKRTAVEDGAVALTVAKGIDGREVDENVFCTRGRAIGTFKLGTNRSEIQFGPQKSDAMYSART